MAITAVEVALGIVKPEFLLVQFAGTSLLNLIFIGLTLVKAAYIVMYFMHLKFDSKIFSFLFYTGLGLALFVYIVALATFKFFIA